MLLLKKRSTMIALHRSGDVLLSTRIGAVLGRSSDGVDVRANSPKPARCETEMRDVAVFVVGGTVAFELSRRSTVLVLECLFFPHLFHWYAEPIGTFGGGGDSG